MGKMTINGMARRIAGMTEDPDKSAALAEYLGIQPNGIMHTYGNVYKVIASDDEYIVCKDETEADDMAYESVKYVLDDCGYSVVNGFESFVNWSYFDDDRLAYWKSYCEDIANEPDDEFANRLIFEAYDNGIIDDDAFEQDEDGLIIPDKCLVDEKEIVERLAQHLFKLEDAKSFVIDMYGKDLKNLPADAIDEDALIQYVIDEDGRGPQLASYDGNEIEFEFEGEQYYIYRVN